MAIDFNRTNTTAGLSKPATQPVRQNSAQLNSAESDKNVRSEQSTLQAQVSTGESVQLSKDALQLQNLSDKITAQPSVNAEKVAQLKQAIAEGSYQVDNQRVASKLLDLEAQF